MTTLTPEIIQRQVEVVLQQIDNPLGFRLKSDGIVDVDGRWWVILEADNEPPRRSEVWDRLAEIEEKLEEADVKVLVTST